LSVFHEILLISICNDVFSVILFSCFSVELLFFIYFPLRPFSWLLYHSTCFLLTCYAFAVFTNNTFYAVPVVSLSRHFMLFHVIIWMNSGSVQFFCGYSNKWVDIYITQLHLHMIIYLVWGFLDIIRHYASFLFSSC